MAEYSSIFKQGDKNAFGPDVKRVVKEQIVAAVMLTPWAKYLPSDIEEWSILEVDNGTWVVRNPRNGWVIATVSQMTQKIEVNGLMPDTQGETIRFAHAKLVDIVERGYLKSDYSPKVGVEIEGTSNSYVPEDKRVELGMTDAEWAMQPHLNIFDLAVELMQRYQEEHDGGVYILPTGWPLVLDEINFAQNDVSAWVSFIAKRLHDNHVHPIPDSDHKVFWQELALRYKSKYVDGTERESLWDEQHREVGSHFLVLKNWGTPLSYSQFHAKHRNLSLHSNDEGFASATYAVELGKAFSLRFVDTMMWMFNSGSNVAWGGRLRLPEGGYAQGDARMLLRQVLHTTHNGRILDSVDELNNRMMLGTILGLSPTIERTAGVVQDEAGNPTAVTQHARFRLRTSMEMDPETNKPKPKYRFEHTAPSSTWAVFDDLAGDAMMQLVDLLTTLALANGVSVDLFVNQIAVKYQVQDCAEAANIYLDDNSDVELYARHGQSMPGLREIFMTWEAICKHLSAVFPDDSYVQNIIHFMYNRMRTIVFDAAPRTIAEYIQRPVGEAWKVVDNMIEDGWTPEDIESQIRQAYPILINDAAIAFSADAAA